MKNTSTKYDRAILRQWSVPRQYTYLLIYLPAYLPMVLIIYRVIANIMSSVI